MKKIYSISTAAIVGLALTSTAKAGVGYGGDFTGYGNDTAGPELYIFWNGSSASVVTAASLGLAGGVGGLVDQGPYDGSDDTYIGVINQSSSPLLSLTLNSSLDIFGFDGDGITTYGAPGNSPADTTGYGGPGVTYGGINAAKTSGTVFFGNGAGLGASNYTYFSLEEPIVSATGSGGGTFSAGSPDSGSTMALLGGALAGIGALSRRAGAPENWSPENSFKNTTNPSIS
jgi:hypothetical protein